ncbi:RNA polymerase sigma factor [Lacihabitans lacunae]|uniref:RNA polymerase sigma factor n=1 Tax=Lacihabitans lacunae TaxID=1028214 RepID=A0ABV7YVV9_9BACT
MTTLKTKYSEEELVTSLKKNSKQAFEYLYDNYSASIFGVICKVLKNEEKAEDVMQDVFLKIWKKIGDYDPSKGRLFTWMVNIARNASIDQLRKEKNVWFDDIDQAVGQVDKISNFQPQTNLIDLRGLLEKLKPERKVLVDLVYLQGYTQEEAAEILKIPLGTAKSRIRTALQDLKTFFNI